MYLRFAVTAIGPANTASGLVLFMTQSSNSSWSKLVYSREEVMGPIIFL